MPLLMDNSTQYILPFLYIIPYAIMILVIGPLTRNYIQAKQEYADKIWKPIARIWNFFY